MILADWPLHTWNVIVASAPWLLAGFAAAGALHVFLPTQVITKHLRTPGLGSVTKASLFGIPLPLCSCSVIPVAVSLRKKGASRGATASFMVSTPEIGVDSFLLSYALLGPLVSIVRVISSFFSAMVSGILVDRMPEQDAPADTKPDAPSSGCCSHSQQDEAPATQSNQLYTMLRYGFVDIVDDLAKLLLIGFLLAGLASALIPPTLVENSFLSGYGAIIVMLAISLPVYVCATSSTPLAAVLLAKGFSVGAVLIFLLAGPATNLTTMLAVRQELGKRALLPYLTGIFSVSIATALLIDAFISAAELNASIQQIATTHEHHSLAQQLAGVTLVILLLTSLLKPYWKSLSADKSTAKSSCCQNI